MLRFCLPRRSSHSLGGCLFAENEACPADRARLFWSAEVDPHVLTLRLDRPRPGDTDTVDFARLGVPLILLRGGDGGEHILLRNAIGHLRIDVTDGTALDGPVVPQADFIGLDGIGPKLLSLRRLRGLARQQNLPRSLFPRDRRAQRWTYLLRALDGLAAGASRRDIAAALFGRTRTAEEWSAPSDHLRTGVQRIVREARKLVAGGYRKLLEGADIL
jgi:hypothetical protein